MEQNDDHIDYKIELEKALATIGVLNEKVAASQTAVKEFQSLFQQYQATTQRTEATYEEAKVCLQEASATIQQQQLKIDQLEAKYTKVERVNQDLQFQLAQLQKLVFGSRHEKFVSSDAQMAPTLFDIPAIPELLILLIGCKIF